ncbi:MAG: serine/threonine protein kinase [Geminocystis sp.]|nr:serine/threonine protein kinase [Geminocystis sp.]HIK36896.1 serine/threonine protein kinase [Geminocystis sp. M7585_C2015_104]MCS7148540.1 serine/threonine protein kinase [Geminocystis sp.]MCX8079496.1 serine/threonine protein kinase [Geminocystis sp.]MDW8114887.1 serine/threonine-protein kinase [Geminocystis sp.]
MKNPHYRTVGLVGEGQFGKVYGAIVRETGELVALKELNPQKFSTKRFLREIRILLKLEHPNIIRCYGVAHSGDKRYLVTEYCEGGSLRDLICKSQTISLLQRLKIVLDILDGLHYAHTEGIIHRDLKPENILLSVTSQGWKAKISDFGVAKIEREDTNGSVGDTGSPAYMAPEQFYGKYYYASDIYATGVILYELLVGDRPFKGSPYEIMLGHLNRPPVFPKNLPASLRLILRQALQKLPQHRFRTALEMKGEILRAILELEDSGVSFYDKLLPNRLSLNLIQQNLLQEKVNFIVTRDRAIYLAGDKKVVVKTFLFNSRKKVFEFCFKTLYFFERVVKHLTVLENGCLVATGGDSLPYFDFYHCHGQKCQILGIKTSDLRYGAATDGSWLAVSKIKHEEEGFQLINLKKLAPVTPLIKEFIPKQIIGLDRRHGVVIYTQDNINKDYTYFRFFNRRGMWYDTYTVFVPLTGVVFHSRESKAFLAREKQTNNMILIKFYPFSVQRIPLSFYADYYLPLNEGFCCINRDGKIALVGLDGEMMGESKIGIVDRINSAAPLLEDKIILLGEKDGQQKLLVYEIKVSVDNINRKIVPLEEYRITKGK